MCYAWPWQLWAGTTVPVRAEFVIGQRRACFMADVRTTVFGGRDVALAGSAVQPGDTAPNFQVIDQSLQPRTLDDFKGKTLIIASVPSLDTGVCDAETRRFNEIAGELGDQVQILTISMD